MTAVVVSITISDDGQVRMKGGVINPQFAIRRVYRRRAAVGQSPDAVFFRLADVCLCDRDARDPGLAG